VSKGKLQKFAEMESFQNVVQPAFNDIFHKDFVLKGKWNRDFFHADLPLTIELGCGKGEYTVEMAGMFRDRNFLGVDIKGARIWKGAKTALNNNLKNAGFVRTRIDFIDSFFSRDEVSEIWITFPDPQLKKARKRLTSARFLTMYKNFLRPEGVVHLKTDSAELYDYTLALAKWNDLEIEYSTKDIYRIPSVSDVLKIRTYYENMWLEEGLPIHYIRFKLNGKDILGEIPGE
jgi:tRNA (guanine-N7-)-methyltransferase